MMETLPYPKTMVAWHRLGKEHGDEDLRVNPPEVLRAHIAKKVAKFRQTPPDAWRWWQVNENLILEGIDIASHHPDPGTHIFYLLKRGLTVIENIYLPPPNDHWKWYIHISDFDFKSDLDCWIMQDYFCHVCVENDAHTYHLFDLPDLAQALDISLITATQSKEILKRVDRLVNSIARGEFPFPEIKQGQEACKKLGWV